MDIVERLLDVAAMDLRTGGFLAHTMDTAAMAAAEIKRLRSALQRQHIPEYTDPVAELRRVLKISQDALERRDEQTNGYR